MFHRLNHGLFNVRVDPVAWNIPHYLEVVKHPMDLSLIKNKCLNLEYESPEQCAQDIRLVFENACLFNPPGHAVHEAAELMMKEFEAEYLKFNSRQETQAKKKKEHTCASCLANVCGICNEKCINFEPPLIMCTGPCKQKNQKACCILYHNKSNVGMVCKVLHNFTTYDYYSLWTRRRQSNFQTRTC
jgi:hypothetical protein